jgi:hypothetical protein
MKTYMVALVVVVGVLGGFYGGYKVGQNNVSASASTNGARASTNTGSNAFGAGRQAPFAHHRGRRWPRGRRAWLAALSPVSAELR